MLGGGNITTVSPLNINGGTLQGAGTVTGDVALTAATLVVAGSTGTTTIDGTFSMTAASGLDVEVGGPTQGVATNGFDHLAVTGTADLRAVLTATGGDTDDLKRTLDGDVNFAITDGALEKVDMVNSMCSALAALDLNPRPGEVFTRTRHCVSPGRGTPWERRTGITARRAEGTGERCGHRKGSGRR